MCVSKGSVSPAEVDMILVSQGQLQRWTLMSLLEGGKIILDLSATFEGL